MKMKKGKLTKFKTKLRTKNNNVKNATYTCK